MTLEMRSLQGKTITELTELFNYGFTEYVIPLQLTEAQVRDSLTHEDICLESSFEAVRDGKPVGFCWTAIRGEVAWCAGVGIGPDYRGLGVGRALLSHTLDHLRSGGLKKYTLECIKDNPRALGLYESLGLRVIGDLYNFKLIQPVGGEVDLGAYRWIPGNEVDLVRYWETLHAVPKSWQADLPALLHCMDQLEIRLMMDGEDVVGMAVCAESPKGVVIRDLGVKGEDPVICRMMVKLLQQAQKPVFCQFVPERSVVAKVLAEAGYERFVDQVQMEMEIR